MEPGVVPVLALLRWSSHPSMGWGVAQADRTGMNSYCAFVSSSLDSVLSASITVSLFLLEISGVVFFLNFQILFYCYSHTNEL